jgi:hypothetical protein
MEFDSSPICDLLSHKFTLVFMVFIHSSGQHLYWSSSRTRQRREVCDCPLYTAGFARLILLANGDGQFRDAGDPACIGGLARFPVA